MDLKEALQRLGELQTRLYAYNCASSSLYLDGVTVAPRDTSQGRGVAWASWRERATSCWPTPGQASCWTF